MTKILIINKSYSSGGAAIAARRLVESLLSFQVRVKVLIQEKSPETSIYSNLNSSIIGRIKRWLYFFLERLYFFPYEKSKIIRYAFSPAIAGDDISEHHLIKESDILHLHWFNQGFLSLKSLSKLLDLNKPVVWTLHDMWAFTGGCHYAGDCDHFKSECGNCKYLKRKHKRDLSHRIFSRKKKIYNNKLVFVTCSNWLREKAKSSTLLKNYPVYHIPNPIDTDNYKPSVNKLALFSNFNIDQNKRIILFGAAKVDDKRKGINFLIDALTNISIQDPEYFNNIVFLVFGQIKTNLIFPDFLSIKVVGRVDDPVNLYQVSDLFILPSLEDNLPNTIMESLSCGTPVVSFNVGGIPEMIDHKKNGYLAEYKSSDDLAKGIRWILEHNNPELLEKNAREKVLSHYSMEIVAEKYNNLYTEIEKSDG